MRKTQKTIHMALQGGGAHGAYTWGVIDKLLEDGRINFDGICATSAGSINAVVFASGKLKDGHDGARQALYDLWYSISVAGNNMFGPQNMGPLYKKMRSMTHSMFDTITHMVSPYQFNPYNYNVLREIIEKQVDFDRIKKCKLSNLFISTTNVKTGKVKIFNNKELSIDVIMASTCLPYLFQAVKIDDEFYWDGGYMGNPAIFPLFYHGGTNDVLIIHINPIVRSNLPTTPEEIMNRINEITFNSSLLAEFRAVAFVNKLLEKKLLKDKHKDLFRHILVHSVRADDSLKELDVSSKFDTNWNFLTHLRDLGRSEAANWLAKNFKYIGKKSSVDLEQEYLRNSDKIV